MDAFAVCFNIEKKTIKWSICQAINIGSLNTVIQYYIFVVVFLFLIQENWP